jgi:acyclic terpene utilization AtuA family protein
MTDAVKLIAPTGVLGIGFSYRSFRAALQERPDVIACDAGSTDWGPYHLGNGSSWSGEAQTRRDLEILLLGAREQAIPLLIGTAGFTGSEPGLTWTRGILEDIAAEHGLSFRLGLVHSEVTPEWVKGALDGERVRPLDGVADLTPQTVDDATRIVAMMGPEPFQQALDGGADVVLAGRASDAAVYASVPLHRGVEPGPAWHLGKLVECGNAITDPVSAGACVVGTVDDDGLTVHPAGDTAVCTTQRVAAHMLYENATPYFLREPPGTLDTSEAIYSQLDAKTVRVTGSAFKPEPYSVRLEGVRHVGYRSVCLVGLRDPRVIASIDLYCDQVAALLAKSAPRRFGVGPEDYTISFRRYGMDAVLGTREPLAASGQTYEVGLVLEILAADQYTAHQLVAASLPYVMHGVQVPGTQHSANGALAFSPAVMDLGPAFEWSVWHQVALDDPLDPFEVEFAEVGAAVAARA